jgi:hypothetical protein
VLILSKQLRSKQYAMNIFILLIIVLILVFAGSFLMWMYILKDIMNNPINNKEKLIRQLIKGIKNDSNFIF